MNLKINQTIKIKPYEEKEVITGKVKRISKKDITVDCNGIVYFVTTSEIVE